MATKVATRIDPFGNRKSAPKNGTPSPKDNPLRADEPSPASSPPGEDNTSGADEPTPTGTPSASDPVPQPNSQPQPPAPERTATDRNKAGQFQKGCRPGPGNPFGRKIAALRKALLESVSEADLARLGQAASAGPGRRCRCGQAPAAIRRREADRGRRSRPTGSGRDEAHPVLADGERDARRAERRSTRNRRGSRGPLDPGYARGGNGVFRRAAPH